MEVLTSAKVEAIMAKWPRDLHWLCHLSSVSHGERHSLYKLMLRNGALEVKSTEIKPWKKEIMQN